jgi:hypothetical protein
MPQFLAFANGILGMDNESRTSSYKGPMSSRGGGSLRLSESSHIGPYEVFFACSSGISALASAGGTDRNLAGPQFAQNCEPTILYYKYFKIKTL